MPETGERVVFKLDGKTQQGVVLRVETIDTWHGRKRCLSVRIPGDSSTRGYRFICESKVISFDCVSE